MLRLLFLLFFATAAHAQSIQQSGTVTPGHAVCWTTNGIAQDCGTAAIPFTTAFGVTSQGQGICVNSGPVTSGYNQLCLGNDASGNGVLSFFNINQPHGTLNANINGVIFGLGNSIPGIINGSIIVPVRSSGATVVTISGTTDYFLCLDPTANAIQLNLPPTPATGLSFLLKDCTGQSAVHNITAVPASGNIDGSPTLVINTPYSSTAVTYTGAQWSTN